MRLALLLGMAAASLWGQTISIDCNQPAHIVVSQASPRASLQFQGSAGEAIYFRIVQIGGDANFPGVLQTIRDQFGNTSSRNVRPTRQTDPGATPLELARQGFEVDLFADSLYTLLLDSAGSTSSAELQVVMVRLNRPCPTTATLACGRPAAGSISSGTATAPPVQPGQVDTYRFEANAADVLSVRLLRTAVSGFIDTTNAFVLAVYGPDGHAINVDAKTNRLTLDALSGNVYERVDLKIAGAGTLTLLVFEPSGGRGGNYYISATRLNGGCGGTALTCGAAQDSQIAAPLGLGFYSLQATQGDVWQFRAARTATSGTFAPYVEVYDAQGTRVGNVPAAAATGHAFTQGSVTIPGTGSYSVLVGGPLDGSTGGYSVAAMRLNRPCAEQALGCSSIVDGAISGALRSHVYSLAASAGDNYLIRLLQPNPGSLFRPRVDIYDASGGSVQFLNTPDLDRRNFTAGSDGTFTVVVTDSFDGTQSGNYSLSMLRLNRACDPGTLSCGAPSAGTLARSLANGVYTYRAAEGESFSVRLLPTGDVQPSVEVYDALGNRTGQAMNGTFAGVDVVRPTAGGYTIVALDNSRTPVTGPFTLDVLRTKNACGQPAPQGQTVSGVVSAAAPFVSYTIPAEAGDVLALRSASSTPGFSAQMELYDPDGNRLDSPAVFGLSRKAAAAGAYTVIVGAAAARTAGGYAFAWQSLNKPAGSVPLACGGTVAGALAGANQFRYYTVAADAGDTMRVIFTRASDTFAPQVELFDSAGARLAGNSNVTQKASAAGNYLLVVSPSTTAFETGSYTVAYQRPNNPCAPAALTCGQTKLRQVTLPGQLDTLTFNGTGGDLTTIRLATRSGSYSPFVEMYNAAGTLITPSSNGLIRRALPADGVYTLLVRDSGATNLGSYRVSLQDETNNCPVTDGESPAITLMKPTGGEVLPGGAVFRIQWLSDDNVGVASHDIAISTDGGKTFPTTVASGLGGNQQFYDWLVPADVAPSRTAAIRVTATDAAGNAQSAASDLLTLIGSGFTPNATASYTYDSLNRLTQVVTGDGRTVQYRWDAAGNLVRVTVTGQ